MFLFLIILLYFVIIVLGLLLVYNTYCLISLIKTIKSILKDISNYKEYIKQSKFNIYLIIIRLKEKFINNRLSLASSFTKYIIIALLIDLLCIPLIIYLIALNISIHNMNIATLTVTNSILRDDKNKDCACYAKCTGDSVIDKYTAFELIFGKDEFKKFTDLLDGTIKVEQKYSSYLTGNNNTTYNITYNRGSMPAKEIFDKIKNSGDTALISEFIQNNLNNNMIAYYRDLVKNNKTFNLKDSKNRSTMSFEELKKDLVSMFSDIKTNGRNLRCKHCSKLPINNLYKSCNGLEHKQDEWSWDLKMDKYDSIDSIDSTIDIISGGSNTPGNAVGNSVVTFSDGTSWYWYHQSSIKSKYNVTVPGTNKGVGSILLNGRYTMAYAGCSIYSLAMTVSNIMGIEYTPVDAIEDFFGYKIINGTYFNTTSTGGTHQSGNDMYINKPVIVSKLKNKYEKDGLEVKYIPSLKVSELHNIFDNSEYYSMVYSSYNNLGVDDNFKLYSGGGHYMVIRNKTKNGKFKLLTSCGSKYLGIDISGALKCSDYEVTAEQIVSRHQNGAILVRRKKSLYTNSNNTDKYITVNGVNGVLNPDSWYKEVPENLDYGVVKESDITVSLEGKKVNIYKGLPWKPTNKSHFFDIRKAQNDIKEQFKSAGVDLPKYKVDQITSSRPSNYTNSGRKSQNLNPVKDGITTFGIGVSGPMLSRNYIRDRLFKDAYGFNPNDPRRANGYWKIAMIIVPKGTSQNEDNWLSVPCNNIDIKAHTAYYGVNQTNIALDNPKNHKNNNLHRLQIVLPVKQDDGSNYQWDHFFIRKRVETEGKNMVDIIRDVNNTMVKSTGTQNNLSGFSRNNHFKHRGIKYSTGDKVNISGDIFKIHMGYWFGHYLETYNMSKNFKDYIENKFDILGYVVYDN